MRRSSESEMTRPTIPTLTGFLISVLSRASSLPCRIVPGPIERSLRYHHQRVRVQVWSLINPETAQGHVKPIRELSDIILSLERPLRSGQST